MIQCTLHDDYVPHIGVGRRMCPTLGCATVRVYVIQLANCVAMADGSPTCNYIALERQPKASCSLQRNEKDFLLPHRSTYVVQLTKTFCLGTFKARGGQEGGPSSNKFGTQAAHPEQFCQFCFKSDASTHLAQVSKKT